jgi:hypothetical protein
MITIVKGLVNKVGLSLSELSICGEPTEYRMEFKSENSPDIFLSLVKSPINLSNRLQIFEIEEGQDISFDIEGYYSYEVYQTTSNNLVETGLLKVEGPSTVGQVVTTNQNVQVYVK